ncbi:hypothetical protein RvY_02911 [Ramazzottius varieornatus]|uniref:Uncharacterized protein n=1 Tax=Ramazzottius varieornatus TaxID=947166 RepID=A0A1D1UQ34_RAMVA|nr:hypothetical protein RvY_02911 [Ramazzottius varieornatus]
MEQCFKVFPLSNVVAVREDEFIPLLTGLSNKPLVSFSVIQCNSPKGSNSSFIFTGPDRVEKNKRCLEKKRTPEIVDDAAPRFLRDVDPPPFKSSRRTVVDRAGAESLVSSDKDQVEATTAENGGLIGQRLQKKPRATVVNTQTTRLSKPSASGTKEIPVGSQDNMKVASIETAAQLTVPVAPSLASSRTKSPNETNSKTKNKFVNSCTRCDKQESPAEKLVPCTQCKNRCHIACQAFNPKCRKQDPKTRKRLCEACRHN